MIFTSHGEVPVTLFNSASTRGGWINAEEIAAFLRPARFPEKNRPDVVWTYGGDPVSVAVQHGQAAGYSHPLLACTTSPTATLRPFPDGGLRDRADGVRRRYYWDTLGLACRGLAAGGRSRERVGVDRPVRTAPRQASRTARDHHPLFPQGGATIALT